MKLNPNFIKHTMDGQAVLVPIEGAPFRGLIQGNKSVDVILDCLQQDTTEAEIVNTMYKRFDGDRDIIAADVSDVIRQLKGIGAIDE